MRVEGSRELFLRIKPEFIEHAREWVTLWRAVEVLNGIPTTDKDILYQWYKRIHVDNTFTYPESLDCGYYTMKITTSV